MAVSSKRSRLGLEPERHVTSQRTMTSKLVRPIIAASKQQARGVYSSWPNAQILEHFYDMKVLSQESLLKTKDIIHLKKI